MVSNPEFSDMHPGSWILLFEAKTFSMDEKKCCGERGNCQMLKHTGTEFAEKFVCSGFEPPCRDSLPPLGCRTQLSATCKKQWMVHATITPTPPQVLMMMAELPHPLLAKGGQTGPGTTSGGTKGRKMAERGQRMGGAGVEGGVMHNGKTGFRHRLSFRRIG